MWFRITRLGYNFAPFRINFYEIRNGIIETKKVNVNDVIIKIIETGLVEVDLSKQFLSFENNFLVALEWIDFKNDQTILKENKTIDFASKPFSGIDYVRANTNLKWNSHKTKYNIAFGFYLLVDSQKTNN